MKTNLVNATVTARQLIENIESGGEEWDRLTGVLPNLKKVEASAEESVGAFGKTMMILEVKDIKDRFNKEESFRSDVKKFLTAASSVNKLMKENKLVLEMKNCKVSPSQDEAPSAMKKKLKVKKR